MNIKAKAESLLKKASEKGALRTFLWIAVITAVFAVILIITHLTPMLADDYYYSRNLICGESTAVKNFGDIVRSSVNSYKTFNGRALTFLMYYAVFLPNDDIFTPLNALVFTAVTLLLYQIIRGNRKHSITLYLLAVASVWFFSPEFGQDVFWKSGSVNYLFPMIPILGILYIYRRHSLVPFKKDGALMCVLMFLLGIISGWQLENSSVTVPVITFLYILYFRKTKLPKWAVCGFAGSVLGFAALIAAPGNYVRLERETEAVSLSLPFKFAMITYYWIMFAGVLTAALVLGIIVCRKKEVVSQSLIFAVGALASAYCMIAAPTSPERTWFVTIILMTAAVGIILSELNKSDLKLLPAKAAVFISVAVILGASGADTLLTTYDLHEQFGARHSLLVTESKKPDAVVEVPVYKLKYPLKSHKDALYGLHDIEPGCNPINSHNQTIADYYGVDKIIGVE